jgi:hypothetical protein
MTLLQWSPDGMANPQGPDITNSLSAIYDAWQNFEVIIDIPDTATDNIVGFAAREAAAINEVFYVDELQFYEFSVADSGCQLVNSSISECTDIGVRIANNHVIIQNTQVTGCANRGIEVAAGYRNIVSGNRAYNNGSDTDIENDNQDNFYDAGTNTQNSENSWNYLPTADEPSLGSPHLHSAEIYNGNPADAAIHAIDLSAEIPVGTKLVRGYGTAKSTVAGRVILTYLADRTTVRSRSSIPVADLDQAFEWTAEPDSGRNIYWSVSNASVYDLVLVMEEYNT